MQIRNGRTGQPQEYVEFRPNVGKFHWTAQKSGDTWTVYEVKRGFLGSITILGTGKTREAAEGLARWCAEAKEDTP